MFYIEADTIRALIPHSFHPATNGPCQSTPTGPAALGTGDSWFERSPDRGAQLCSHTRQAGCVRVPMPPGGNAHLMLLSQYAVPLIYILIRLYSNSQTLSSTPFFIKLKISTIQDWDWNLKKYQTKTWGRRQKCNRKRNFQRGSLLKFLKSWKIRIELTFVNHDLRIHEETLLFLYLIDISVLLKIRKRSKGKKKFNSMTSAGQMLIWFICFTKERCTYL